MKNYPKAVLAAAALFAAAGSSAAADGITVEYLGTNNTLVRVNGDSRYVVMPVQESNDDAKVNVIVDGRLERTMFVRLAKSKVDYTVPFDLAPYKGREVVLNIVTSQNRSSVREAKDDACWGNFALADDFDTANREKFRPLYHHTPLYGWMNDPNGMFYKDGEWHLYYQWNPYGSKWQNLSWGHSSSKDLAHWEHHPIAIEPDGLGYIFSGSCAVDTENSAGFGKDAVLAMYTSADVSQIQSLAHSSDNGATFEKHPGNPTLTLESEARDPNMFWNPETKLWTLVLAHALDHEMLIFTSPDMKEWTLRSAFGKGLGCQDGVWECPDLFELPVDGTDERKWMLICNINPGGPFGGSAAQYFIGDFDGETFKADTDSEGKVPVKWLDFGKDNYASVSWSDAPGGRRTIIGWMSNWQYAAEVPTTQYRSANTLPREVSLFRGADGQVYAATNPSPEIDALRGKAVVNVKNVSFGSKSKTYALPKENDGVCEFEMTVTPREAKSVSLTLANAAGNKVVMTYDPAAATFSMDRRESGVVGFSQEFPAVTVAPVFGTDKTLTLRVFIDRSSIEAFGNGGRFAMTNLVFPETPYTTLSLASEGGTARASLKIYPVLVR